MTDLSVSQILNRSVTAKTNRIAPTICGVTWSPTGQLYYFNNLSHHIQAIKSSTHHTTTTTTIDYCLPRTLDDYNTLPVLLDNASHHQRVASSGSGSAHSSHRHNTSPLLDLIELTDHTATTHHTGDTSHTTTPRTMSRHTSSVSTTDSDDDSSDDESDTNDSSDYIRSIYNGTAASAHTPPTTTTTDTKPSYITQSIQRVFYTSNEQLHHDNSSDSELVDLTLQRRTSVHTPHQSPIHRSTPRPHNELKYTSVDTSVAVFDAQCVMPVDVRLAYMYRCYVDTTYTAIDACTHNATVAYQCGRYDLHDMWILVRTLLEPMKPIDALDDQVYYPYALSANGGVAVQAIINQYAALGDTQTAAAVSCLYIQASQRPVDVNSTNGVDGVVAQLTTVTPRTKLLRAASELQMRTTPHRLVNSQSYAANLSRDDSFYGLATIRTIHSTANIVRVTPPITPRMQHSVSHSNFVSRHHRTPSLAASDTTDTIDEHMDEHDVTDLVDINDMYKSAYAEWLLRVSALPQRADVLKSCYTIHEYDTEEYVIDVRHSNAVECVICNQMVRGSTLSCLVCEHSGHTLHMLDWYTRVSLMCPTGCGCECVLLN